MPQQADDAKENLRRLARPPGLADCSRDARPNNFGERRSEPVISHESECVLICSDRASLVVVRLFEERKAGPTSPTERRKHVSRANQEILPPVVQLGVSKPANKAFDEPIRFA